MKEAPRRIQPSAVLNALHHAVVVLSPEDHIVHANDAAQAFFRASLPHLRKKPLSAFVPFGSPLLALPEKVRQERVSLVEYRVDLSSPRLGPGLVVDIQAAPLVDEPDHVVLTLDKLSMAEKIDRALTSRSAARSVSGLAAMLAHEIRNPLSGIRGAAQLLEPALDEDDRVLARLIMAETDRVVKLVDRMEVFGDARPVKREAVNIHGVLDHVERLAKTGVARGIEMRKDYDPSLPFVNANRDQLIQVFLNLVKNAAEALGEGGGTITLTTAYRPGMRVAAPGSPQKVSLPLEFCVKDDGPGVPSDILAHIFEPFVSSKTNGTGLGLALVAKIVGDHGGVIEIDSGQGTTVRILMPAYQEADPAVAEHGGL